MFNWKNLSEVDLSIIFVLFKVVTDWERLVYS
jgi:hypothetical protein